MGLSRLCTTLVGLLPEAISLDREPVEKHAHRVCRCRTAPSHLMTGMAAYRIKSAASPGRCYLSPREQTTPRHYAEPEDSIAEREHADQQGPPGTTHETYGSGSNSRKEPDDG